MRTNQASVVALEQIGRGVRSARFRPRDADDTVRVPGEHDKLPALRVDMAQGDCLTDRALRPLHAGVRQETSTRLCNDLS